MPLRFSAPQWMGDISMKIQGSLLCNVPAVAVCVAVLVYGCTQTFSHRSADPLRQEVYVWNQRWDEHVRDGVANVAPLVDSVIVLASEVSFPSDGMKITRIALNHQCLRQTGRPIGLAIRINRYPGVFSFNDETVESLSELAQSLVGEFGENGISVREVQLDFDCPESKLAGYRIWIESVAKSIDPTPLTITARPSWLGNPNFRTILKITDNYVLQVHSLKRPRRRSQQVSLCPIEKAQRWIEQAQRLGKCFRVALPTYGYLLVFDEKGQFVRAYGESGLQIPKAHGSVQTVMAQADEIAPWVAQLMSKHPENMMGIIWYRMPTTRDQLNWSLETLKTVMEGRTPKTHLFAEVRKVKPSLVEVDLTNGGETAVPPPSEIMVQWKGAGLVAADGVNGYVWSQEGKHQCRLISRSNELNAWIQPNRKLTIAWIRLSDDVEVEAYVDE